MPKEQLDASAFSPDMTEFLLLLHKHHVRYLIVGGEAVIYYGYARLTGDMDIFYDREGENVTRLYAALTEFWQGPAPGIDDAAELLQPDLVVQFGVPPNRLDLINTIDGVTFEKAWGGRTSVALSGPERATNINYVGLSELISNKRASGRPKDQDDLLHLGPPTP